MRPWIERALVQMMACRRFEPWWRHQMETVSALLALCAGKSPVSGEFPAQRQVTRSFDVFFDLRLEINGWVNNREAGDLRRHRAHYNVIVMRDELNHNTTGVEGCDHSKGIHVYKHIWRFSNMIYAVGMYFTSIYLQVTFNKRKKWESLVIKIFIFYRWITIRNTSCIGWFLVNVVLVKQIKLGQL